jgi:hypothetical protein
LCIHSGIARDSAGGARPLRRLAGLTSCQPPFYVLLCSTGPLCQQPAASRAHDLASRFIATSRMLVQASISQAEAEAAGEHDRGAAPSATPASATSRIPGAACPDHRSHSLPPARASAPHLSPSSALQLYWPPASERPPQKHCCIPTKVTTACTYGRHERRMVRRTDRPSKVPHQLPGW